MIAFFLFLFVVVVIYFFTSTSQQKDAFVNVPVIPTADAPVTTAARPNKIDMPTRSADGVTPNDLPQKADALPGHLPASPYEQIAVTSPLPYQDTTMVKANRQQLVSLLELVKGFLAFEAQELSERSDPAIQLPLQTVRSDFQTLQSEVDVVNRNPGIQSTMTLSHLQEISSNLAYLQREVRLTGAAGSLQGPIDEFNRSLAEGFADLPTASATTASQGPNASKKDITDFIARIQGEIQRLTASGTTDMIVNARVQALTQLKAELQEIVTKLDSGAMKAQDIRIKKSDLDRALPILGKPGEALPDLLKATRLPSGWANALPSAAQKDPATLRKISDLLDKYGDTIMNGITATFEVKYAPPKEPEAGRSQRSMVDKTGFPSASDLDHASNAKFMPTGGLSAVGAGAVGVTDRLAAYPTDAGRGPSPARFDWKERAKAIEDQVKKRGLKSSDYGIMPADTKVSKDFSWKGYTKMICTRLQATMDPGLPETCGCPPMDWTGWRMNQSSK